MYYSSSYQFTNKYIHSLDINMCITIKIIVYMYIYINY